MLVALCVFFFVCMPRGLVRVPIVLLDLGVPVVSSQPGSVVQTVGEGRQAAELEIGRVALDHDAAGSDTRQIDGEGESPAQRPGQDPGIRRTRGEFLVVVLDSDEHGAGGQFLVEGDLEFVARQLAEGGFVPCGVDPDQVTTRIGQGLQAGDRNAEVLSAQRGIARREGQ